jgi:hypothetical protein
VPDLDLGLVLLSNQEVGEPLEAIVYQILDNFIDGKSLEELKETKDSSTIVSSYE